MSRIKEALRRPDIDFDEGYDISAMLTSVVKSKSGHLLRIGEDRTRRLIQDVDKDFLLYASVNPDSGEAKFNLQSRVRSIRNLLGKRHSDFYAGKFVVESLEYFRQKGIEVIACKGTWWPGSDNYLEYVVNLKKGMSPTDSALNTWSGRKFSSLGFGQIAPEDVLEYGSLVGLPKVVTALFHQAT